MPTLLQPECRSCRWLAQRVTRAWHEAPPAPRAVSTDLAIPLLPSRLARSTRRLLLLLLPLYGLELLLLGHWLAATAIVALALLAGWQGRGPGAPFRQPRRLLLAADGRLHILTVAGELEAVQLHPSSLRLGPWLLLVLCRPGDRPHRLLLGPDNLDGASLAALRRRMVLVDQLAEAVMPGLQTAGWHGIHPGSPDAAGHHDGQQATSLR